MALEMARSSCALAGDSRTPRSPAVSRGLQHVYVVYHAPTTREATMHAVKVTTPELACSIP